MTLRAQAERDGAAIAAVAVLLAACSGAPSEAATARAVKAAATDPVATTPAAVRENASTVWRELQGCLRERRVPPDPFGADTFGQTHYFSLRAMGRRGTAGAAQLLREREPVLLQLGGQMIGEMFRDIDGMAALGASVVEALHDPRPEWRAFACSSAAELRLRDATDAIAGLLRDPAVVPGRSDGATVGDIAAAALALFAPERLR